VYEARDSCSFEMVGDDGIGSPDEISWFVKTDHRACTTSAMDSNPYLQIYIVFLATDREEGVRGRGRRKEQRRIEERRERYHVWCLFDDADVL
jgi:hypothetical protein